MTGKIAFTFSMLPNHLGENAKFNRWQDIHIAEIWSVEYTIPTACRSKRASRPKLSAISISGRCRGPRER
jgi:hypothetical protein